MKESKVIRILPKEGTQNVNIDIEQDFDYLEILSLKILQKDAYRIFCSDKGVLVGNVTANGGFPLQNAKISIFIPIDNIDIQNELIRSIYPFTTPNDTLYNGKRYNLLPRDKQLATPADHVPVGTFPSKYDIMTNPTLKYIHEKYYKYTTTSNENGDYMFFGLPSGTHIVHCDVDISDIGTNSVTPADLINLGYSPYLFNTATQFKTSNDLNQLAQIVGLNSTTYVNPFWGDPDQCEFGVTRLDFSASRFVNPKGYLIGSIYTDPAEGENNSFVPSACWQAEASFNTGDPIGKVGFKAGVSRIISAQTVRTPRQVRADGEGVGHIGIIEAVRLNEDGVPEYAGKWKTDMDGNFVIPLPLNLGKKVWDEDLQGWRDDDQDGVATYADYRFKFYFEGQSDINDIGASEVQLDSTQNRGVLFAPNSRLGQVTSDGTEQTSENSYTFYAQPVYGPTNGYEYNMLDQFGLRIKDHTNYTRIRMSSFYTVGQNFNYVADYDSAPQDLAEDTYGVNWFFEQTQNGAGGWSHYYNGMYNGAEPDWVANSIGANPWIFSRSFVYTDIYSQGDITSRNLFPTNYLFDKYYMKTPSKQDTLLDVNLSEKGGFISNYRVNRFIEANYRGLGFYPANSDMELINGAGDSSNGNSVDMDWCDSLPTDINYRYGELITNSVDPFTNPDWYEDGTMDGCVGCLTFGSIVKTGIFINNESNNGSWYNPGAEPYYGQIAPYTQINPANTIGPGTPGNNWTITGNMMMGGFVAPFAGRYSLTTTLMTTCTDTTNSWIVVGLSYCDSTVYDCNSNGNWSFSGETAYYGNTNTDGTCLNTGGARPGIAPVSFEQTAGNDNPADPNADSWKFGANSEGELIWKSLYLKEGMGLRVTVRPTLSDDNWSPVANNNRATSRVGVCYHCAESFGSSGACPGQSETSSFGVHEVHYGNVLNENDRMIEEPLHGALYFPQYYVGADESECCSRSNTDPDQRWESGWTIPGRQRTFNWNENSLLYAGTYTTSGSIEYRNYNDEGGDPLGGQTIKNAKYYNLNTIGEVKIVEITKDIPNFQQGVNQWATLDKNLPSSSAHHTQEMNTPFSTRDNNQEDFDTNGDGTGRQYTQHKYFAPYDNLLFRTGQQWPRDNNEDGTDILCPETSIPGSWDWTSSNWYTNLMYPVQNTYNPSGYLTFSNYHVFEVVPTASSESAQWGEWIRRVPKVWHATNTFWWSTIQPVPTTSYTGLLTTPLGDGNPFDNQKGASNAQVSAYPMRKYYYFSVYYNLSPATTLKKILGYNTGLID